MAKKDYYDILGVSKTATDAEIKSAFRKKAKEYHPDVNKEPGAAEKFKEISEAYGVLGDANKRKQYDQFGSAAFENGGMGGGAGGFGGFDAGNIDLDEILRNVLVRVGHCLQQLLLALVYCRIKKVKQQKLRWQEREI